MLFLRMIPLPCFVSPHTDANFHRPSSHFSPEELKTGGWCHIALVVGITLLTMASSIPANNAGSQSLASKWMHNGSTILFGMVATYLTMLVLVDCTVRILLLRLGYEIQTTETENPNQQSYTRRRSAELDRHIQRSLRDLAYDHGKDSPECCASATTCNSCGSSDKEKDGSGMVAVYRGSGCCSICLEDFKPGDNVVAGRRDCCKSNVFHEACIKQWLRINDSCPCCRTPMLEPEEDQPTEENFKASDFRRRRSSVVNDTVDVRSNGTSYTNMGTVDGRSNSMSYVSVNSRRNSSTTTTIRDTSTTTNRIDTTEAFRSQFRIKIDTATRLRNEILSYFAETRRES